jgi:predicted 3-demethylubiquinone-9 3-methyltransferase (glyoxalase superfamily)
VAQKISPFLWFDDNAEEAARFYVSIFPDSAVLSVNRIEDAGPDGQPVTTVSFRLSGLEFLGLDGGPLFKFTEAISFSIDCETQEEVDYYWKKLTAGGEPSQCGWLKDRFGLSWQVVPRVLIDMLQDKDRERANRVMQAMLQMSKIEIPALERAYAGT